MLELLCFVLAILAAPFKSRRRLEAENVVLRHQMIILRRKVPGQVRLTNGDRWFLVQLYRLFPAVLQGSYSYPPRDPGALASGWLSRLLALEVRFAGRAA